MLVPNGLALPLRMSLSNGTLIWKANLLNEILWAQRPRMSFFIVSLTPKWAKQSKGGILLIAPMIDCSLSCNEKRFSLEATGRLTGAWAFERTHLEACSIPSQLAGLGLQISMGAQVKCKFTIKLTSVKSTACSNSNFIVPPVANEEKPFSQKQTWYSMWQYSNFNGSQTRSLTCIALLRKSTKNTSTNDFLWINASQFA